MRKYLKKYANGIYYISEGYNENQMIASGFSNITAGISAGRKMIREIGDSLSDPVYGVKWVDSYIVYAACEKQEVKKLESYIVVNSVGELIGKGGGLWSKHTPHKLEKIIG